MTALYAVQHDGQSWRVLHAGVVMDGESHATFEAAATACQRLADATHEYSSQAARDAQASAYGDPRYWAGLDEAAQRHHDYYMRHGEPEKAAEMLTRSLSEALAGNNGA